MSNKSSTKKNNRQTAPKRKESTTNVANQKAATQNKENEHISTIDAIRQSLLTHKQLNDHNTMLQTKFIQQEEIIISLAETIASLKAENEHLRRLIKCVLAIENPDIETLDIHPSKKRKDVHSAEDEDQ